MRMQFYAVEISRQDRKQGRGVSMLTRSRNRRGLNDWIYEQAHPGEAKTK